MSRNNGIGASGISEFLQVVLRVRDLGRVDAVTAAGWLDAVGILRDSRQRPGLPLRKLLRAGKIIGQLQETNRHWFVERQSNLLSPARSLRPRSRRSKSAYKTSEKSPARSDVMVVTAWNNGSHHPSGAGYGLKVAAVDRDRQFDRSWKAIVVRLPDGRDAEANIDKKSFWGESCRELISQEIGAWLIGSGLAPWPSGSPPKLELRAISPRRFILQPQI